MIRALGLTIALAGLLALAGSAGPARSSGAAPAPIGRTPLQTRGIWTQFENPSASFGWFSGEVIQQLGSTGVRRAVAGQLDRMRAMGVNEITYELRSADPVWLPGERTPPECNVPPVLGVQWPQPTRTELSNLGAFFDLAQAKGIRVALMLDNTHMEEQPPTNSTRWIGAILGVLKDKPALDYVMFGGDEHLLDLNGDGIRESCGGQSEAPLWLGVSGVGSRYVAWAIRYGMSLGVPASKLTAEAIVGDFEDLLPDGGPYFWRPILVLKQIFDQIGIPQAERTYALSLYEHRKCTLPSWLAVACRDESPHEWADATLRGIVATVGPGARITAPEYGDRTPIEASWPTEKAVESLGVLMQHYGVDGGSFWTWVWGGPKGDPTLADPVVRRGTGFTYNPVQRELADLYGFHLTAIPNGSFESGATAWKFAGRGTARPTPLDQVDLPWRGKTFLRLTATGSGSISSAPIRVSGSTTYTTTANLRFAWGREPRPTPVPRPQVDVVFRYLTCAMHPVAGHPEEVFRYFQRDSTNGFATFPLEYTTAADACYVRIRFVAARNHLATPLTLDVDNVR